MIVIAIYVDTLCSMVAVKLMRFCNYLLLVRTFPLTAISLFFLIYLDPTWFSCVVAFHMLSEEKRSRKQHILDSRNM